jgi:hypothetical protein
MKRTAPILLIATIAALFSMHVLAQQYSCSKMEWPDRIASIYENVEPA